MMENDRDETTAGFSRKVEYNEVYMPRIQRSGVSVPVKWDENWNNPDYRESYEEKRPKRSRRVRDKLSVEVRLGTMEVPKDGKTFTDTEMKLLKKLKRGNNK